MELSPDTLRQVEFREQWRGYSQDEVDDFLERVAAAVAELQTRLAEAVERAARAEERVLEGSPSEEELRRTLVLAQRTADAARREAEDEAARMLEQARQEADRLVRESTERAQAIDEDARLAARREVDELAAARAALAADVESLRAHMERERARLRADAERLLAGLDDGASLTVADPPALAAVDIPEPAGTTPDAIETADHAGEEPAPVAAEPAEAEPLEVSGAPEPVMAEPDAGAGEAEDDDDSGGDAPSSVDEPTAAHPAPAFEEADAPPDEAGDGADDTGEIAAAGADADELEHAMEHDPFLAELRRAVTDTEPLGPRDDVEHAASGEDPGVGDLYDQDLAPASRFRLRRRR